MPDFAAMTTAMSGESPSMQPDFAALNIKTRPTIDPKKVALRTATPVTDVKETTAAKTAQPVSKPSKANAEASDKVDIRSPADLPRDSDKKATGRADELAGFREFAAIVNVASTPAAPAAPSLIDVGTPSRLPDAATAAITDSPVLETSAGVKAGAAPAHDRSSKPAHRFGEHWIPMVVDMTAVSLFATAIYVLYALYSGDVSTVMGMVIAVAMAATGVMMSAIALGLRLLLQIADSPARQQSE